MLCAEAATGSRREIAHITAGGFRSFGSNRQVNCGRLPLRRHIDDSAGNHATTWYAANKQFCKLSGCVHKYMFATLENMPNAMRNITTTIFSAELVIRSNWLASLLGRIPTAVSILRFDFVHRVWLNYEPQRLGLFNLSAKKLPTKGLTDLTTTNSMKILNFNSKIVKWSLDSDWNLFVDFAVWSGVGSTKKTFRRQISCVRGWGNAHRWTSIDWLFIPFLPAPTFHSDPSVFEVMHCLETEIICLLKK